mgnify:CR=1 FL=1
MRFLRRWFRRGLRFFFDWLRWWWRHPAVRRAVTLVAAVFIVATTVYAVIRVPLYQDQHWGSGLSPLERATLVNEFRRTLAQIIGGVFVLVGLYFAWKRIEVSREDQITERFSRAIEHLGSDKLDVRLGGIYALERIARDSKRDHWTVMEVLSAFVRERARWRPSAEPFGAKEQADAKPTLIVRADLLRPNVDIQAAMAVIGRRRWWKTETERLDLHNVDLTHISLENAHLERAEFLGACLEGARLEGAHLEEAALSRAYFGKASLRHAHLEGACLCRANLAEAALSEARLELGDLRGAHLTEANLQGAHLERARLADANLEWAALGHARLEGTDLTRAQLQHADLRGVDLRRVTGVTREQLAQAITDETMLLPDYLPKLEAPAQPPVQPPAPAGNDADRPTEAEPSKEPES